MLSLCLSLFLSLSALAFEVPPFRPNVVDEARVLSVVELETVNQAIDEAQKHGVLIGVLLVDTLAGTPIEDAAELVFRRWQLGEKGKDNGILILAAIRDRNVRIEVGYGLEARITDYLANDIIRTAIVPAFKRASYAEGLIQAIGDLSSSARGEFPAYVQRGNENFAEFLWRSFIWFNGIWVLPFIISVVGIVRARRRDSFTLTKIARLKPRRVFWQYLSAYDGGEFGMKVVFTLALGFPITFLTSDTGTFHQVANAIGLGCIGYALILAWQNSEDIQSVEVFRASQKRRWERNLLGSGRGGRSSASSGRSSSSSFSSSSRSSSSSGGRSGGGGASGSW